MKNHNEVNEIPWGNSDYDSEDCYGQPWDWSARENSQPVQSRIQNNTSKQPVRAIDADNAVRFSS
jgi:hypothetical protein